MYVHIQQISLSCAPCILALWLSRDWTGKMLLPMRFEAVRFSGSEPDMANTIPVMNTVTFASYLITEWNWLINVDILNNTANFVTCPTCVSSHNNLWLSQPGKTGVWGWWGRNTQNPSDLRADFDDEPCPRIFSIFLVPAKFWAIHFFWLWARIPWNLHDERYCCLPLCSQTCHIARWIFCFLMAHSIIHIITWSWGPSFWSVWWVFMDASPVRHLNWVWEGI